MGGTLKSISINNNNMYGEEGDKSSGTVLNDMKNEIEDDLDRIGLFKNQDMQDEKEIIKNSEKKLARSSKKRIEHFDEIKEDAQINYQDNMMFEEESKKDNKKELIIQPIEVIYYF